MFNEEDYYYEDEYFYHEHPNHLGESGVTMYCVLAMAAILTGTFRPKKITLVSLRDQPDHDGVMFVVWGWPETPGYVLVPDGFGTHGGEGGGGLSSVLGLIQFYNIPMVHVVVRDKAMFNKLAQGDLEMRMFSMLKKARPYNWGYYRVHAVQITKQGKETFLEVGNYWKFRVAGPLK